MCSICYCQSANINSTASPQGLLRFVVPLGVVYFAEYFINQGLVSKASVAPWQFIVSLQLVDILTITSILIV